MTIRHTKDVVIKKDMLEQFRAHVQVEDHGTNVSITITKEQDMRLVITQPEYWEALCKQVQKSLEIVQAAKEKEDQ